MSDRSKKAGAILREHVDVRGEDSEHVELRARVVRAAQRQRRRRPLRVATWVVAPAVVLAAVVLLVLRSPAPTQPVNFTVGDGRSAGIVGNYLGPQGQESLPLRFTDGSRILLMPSARARVTTTTVRGAKLLLESGRVECDIAHLAGAEWVVAAGPYTIDVLGTSFDVSWDTSRATLEVQMRQGSVRLRGPGVDGEIQLRDQQRFVISLGGRAAPSSPVAVVDSDPVDGSVPSARSVESAPEIAPATPPEARAQSAAAPHDAGPMLVDSGAPIDSAAPAAEASDAAEEPVAWTQLVARGQYARVVSAAEAQGIDSVLSSSSMADVGALADAARFAGRGALALRALHAIRSRFPGSGRAASAAFVLGRTAEDAGQTAAALNWYNTYLAEAPGGALAPEALGRRMLSLRRMGNSAAAKQAAEAYLERFPRGPYSGVAREMTTP